MNLQASSPPILQVEQLTKKFGDVVALDHVNLDVRRGEIHCLLGENGAGKTTLAECLFGLYRADHGIVRFKGEILRLISPHEAIAARIGMVHQHFALARRMTAVENIVVGTSSRGLAIGLKEASNKVQALCAEYGITLDLHVPISNLSIGQQQWVEIIKALYLDAELLILDEPTAVLTPQEADGLLQAISKMKASGLSVILITHKLSEVMDFADRVTVMRQGRVVKTVITAEVSRQNLIEMMVGHSLEDYSHKSPQCSGQPVLILSRLVVMGDDNREVLHGLDLQVRSGEIVGLAGVSGNGQTELFDVILGVRGAATGQVMISGHEVANKPPGLIMRLGVASIPPDRMRQGLLMGFPIMLSLILGLQNSPPFRRGLTLNKAEVWDFAERMLKDFQVVAESPNQITNTLSGGNLQRLILAREMAHKPSLLIAFSPTRGLDIAATQYVHERIFDLRDSGVGVLLISEDLDEVLRISDRVAVIYRGRIIGELPSSEANRDSVGLLMAGFDNVEGLPNPIITEGKHPGRQLASKMGKKGIPGSVRKD